MWIEEQYRQILSELKRGGRPRWKGGEEEWVQVEKAWRQLLAFPSSSGRDLLPLFCLLSHAQTLTNRFDWLLVQTLSLSFLAPEVLVAGLGCLQRQVADRCERTGERFPPQVVACLKGLLVHDNSEVFYWCLRSIERMGAMGAVLREDILANCPGRWESLFCSHKRASRKMIFFLNKQWVGFHSS